MRRLPAIAAAAALFAGTAAAQLPEVDTNGATSIGGSVTGEVSGVTDAAVKGRLESTLREQLALPGVRSDVVNGVAMLRGTVATEAERDEAAEIARGVHGVARVRNDIVVQRDAGPSDASLSAAVRANLDASGTLEGREIEVESTTDNVVRLSGEVSSEAEKALAGKLAEDTDAVAEVRNELVVKTR
jgi:osmotically-inducible protein OsmY